MQAQPRAERALDALSFFVSDARYGLGAYLGVYLMTEHAWDAARVRAKRALIAGAVVLVTATCLVIPLAPVLVGRNGGLIGALAAVTIGPPSRSDPPASPKGGRNEALFHLGDGCISLVILVTAPFILAIRSCSLRSVPHTRRTNSA